MKRKLEPAIEFLRENPKASVKEVCQKFMLSKQSVYNLRYHYGFSKREKKPIVKKPVNAEHERKDKLIQQLLEEIVRQQAIINYLENKLARHGAPI